MKDNALIYLLHAVSRGSNFLSLVNAEYTFSQLALLINEATESGYIMQDGLALTLTEEGGNKLTSLLKQQNLRGKQQWILPQSIYRTEPKKRYDIILPDEIL